MLLQDSKWITLTRELPKTFLIVLFVSYRYLTVMYSVPYSHDFHSNWLALGIHGPEEFSDKGMFDMMYHKERDWFTRKAFHHNLNPVTHTSEYLVVNGTMDNSRRPEILVQLYRNPYSKGGISETSSN